jgi:tetratricopeptide (TPR) repeat protein
MIDSTITKIDTTDIRVGKVYPWKDSLLVYNESGGKILQLSGSGEIIQRLSLKEIADIKRIDTVFIYEENMLIADSLGNKLFRLTIAAGEDGKLTIGAVNEYPQATGTIIVAAVKVGEHYWLLDKGKCQIHVCDKDFKEMKTIGSRMGYIYEYDEDTMPRLGFEFPEDMAQDGERIVVSDSGNKRLVVLNPEGKQLDVIKLPEFPYKIIRMDGERLVVSDFDRTVMMVSLKYGFVYKEEIDTPVDFFPSVYHRQRHIVGSENKELVELIIDDTPLEELAEKAENRLVSMKIKVDKNEIPEARKLVDQYPELLPEYAAYYYDETESIAARLTDYINQTVDTAFKENENLKTEIAALSLEFVKKYKTIPDSEDQEAAHIEKEHVRHQLFLSIKMYRRNLYLVASLKQKINKYSSVLEVLKGLLAQRFEELEKKLSKVMQRVEEHLVPFNDREILDSIVDYWLLEEEEQILFVGWGLRYQKLFDGKFLLGILNDFYSNVATLFFKRNNVEQYIAFSDRELTMFPDKMGIFNSFVLRLLGMGKNDDVLRMLGKISDQNKENVNYFRYRVYLAQGNTDKAFFHLKKELELYSHRVNLIPELIQLNKLNAEEIQCYITNILDKTGQSIDGNLHVAEAFNNIGDFVKAELYTDRELDLFPENKRAILLKETLMVHHSPSVQEAAYYRNTWRQFKNFMVLNRDERIAQKILSMFSVLNFIECSEQLIEEVSLMRERVPFYTYREELNRYLSFLNDTLSVNIDGDIETYHPEEYLAGFSTCILSYNYFMNEVERLKTTGGWTKMFEILVQVLKYNPGDERAFNILEGLGG